MNKKFLTTFLLITNGVIINNAFALNDKNTIIQDSGLKNRNESTLLGKINKDSTNIGNPLNCNQFIVDERWITENANCLEGGGILI